MHFRKSLKACVASLVAFLLVSQMAACGTILYPERRGQKGGKIDPGVAILDGIGLLLFFVPGVIAFAVDFTTGTIYLPGPTKRSGVDGHGEWRALSIPPDRRTVGGIQDTIAAHTGVQVALSNASGKVYEIRDLEEGRQIIRTK